MISTTVLIVGAGPTGLTLANLLARMNVPFVIIDKNKSPSKTSKALAIHARTLEIFKQMGIADDAVEIGNKARTLNILVNGKVRVKLDLQKFITNHTQFPFVLVMEQYKTENLLLELLKRQESDVLWDHECVSFHSENNGIITTIKNSSKQVITINSRYIIGADGAGSVVRQQGKFSFKGKTYDPTFFLADCEVDWSLPHGDIYFSISRQHVAAYFSLQEKNKYRVFSLLNDTIEKTKRDGDFTFHDMKLAIESNRHLQQELKNPDWLSVFKLHARQTNDFSRGNVFLAGDAAHIHSPAGGQGMNTGIQDAYNLAWKLSFVLNKNASAPLLNTYHEERSVIASSLLQTTDRVFSIFVGRGLVIDFYRQNIFPYLAKLITGAPWIMRRAFKRISQIAIHYQFSSLSANGKTSFTTNAPKAGDRVPLFFINEENKEISIFQKLKLDCFTIIFFVQDNYARQTINEIEHDVNLHNNKIVTSLIFEKNSSTESIFKAYGVSDCAVFIVRPDSHIGFRSARIKPDEIKAYFTQIGILINQ